MSEKKDVELIKKVIAVVVKNIKLGKEIAKDGVSASDIGHIPDVIECVKDVISLIEKSKEIADEAKDIDASEIGVLLLAAWTAYKDVADLEA